MRTCGPYTLRQADQLPLRFEASATPEMRAALTPRFNIAPTQTVPIVTEAHAGERPEDWLLQEQASQTADAMSCRAAGKDRRIRGG